VNNRVVTPPLKRLWRALAGSPGQQLLFSHTLDCILKGTFVSTSRTVRRTVVCLLMAVAFPALPADDTPSLDPLQGKWSVTKTNREGQRYSQVIEIKQDKLTFQIRNEEDQLRMAATGTVKLDKAGPFQVLSLSSIQAGRSMEELEPVDETRAVVYQVRDDKLFAAANFDRERENEKPGIDVYVRVAAGAGAATAPAAVEERLLGTWKLEVTWGDNTRDYNLRIAKSDGKLNATLISPRSGEHPCKSVQFKDGEWVIEVERELEGNPATFVYRAKLTGEELAGTVAVKGYEDQFSARIKGTR
jgi:hypothetical protein